MRYKETLHLPQTSLPMKSDAEEQEMKLLADWKREGLYEWLRQAREGGAPLDFHDGPPYAQKNVPFSHAYNKILKDILVRSRNMMGMDCSFVPGWDCHGLPIGLEVEELLQEKRDKLSVLDFRKECRSYAEEAIDEQRSLFQRLGVMAQWDDPYLTMSPLYEAEMTRAIARLIRSGSFTRKNCPVHWCGSCATALAEFELDYRTISSPSLYIGYPLVSDPIELDRNLRGRDIEVVVWTNSPWYLPGSLGISVRAEAEYVVVRVRRKLFLVAAESLSEVADTCGWKRSSGEIVFTCLGKDLANLSCRHPFIHRKIPIHTADFVSPKIGSGCVSLAPGHDREDYLLGQQVGLDVLCPIDARGRFSPQVELWGGQKVFEASSRIVRRLYNLGALLNSGRQQVEHRYPHCRRCKAQTIARATPQWFLSVESKETRERVLEAVEDVKWEPEHVASQMKRQLGQGKDWCLSRQRRWGVPIPVFYCSRCRRPLLDADFVEKLADRFEKHPTGSDLWYESSSQELLELFEQEPRCPRCFLKKYRKEEDVLDVWFDAGLSFKAGFSPKVEPPPVIDVYFESQEQLRGWFPTALLTSVLLYEQAPYRQVWTHGSGPVVQLSQNHEKTDKVSEHEKTNKVSKAGKVDEVPETSALLLVEEYGAELMRLWAVSENAHSTRHFSSAQMDNLTNHQQKLRNICRFALANLHDFEPTMHLIAVKDWSTFEQLAYKRLQDLINSCLKHYSDHAFHHVLFELLAFCENDLSTFVFEVCKDRLYCSVADWPERRSAQSFLFEFLHTIVQLMAPILCFTADEIWGYIPYHSEESESVHLTLFPPLDPDYVDSFEEDGHQWEQLKRLRQCVSQAVTKGGWSRTSSSDPALLANLFFLGGERWKYVMNLSEATLAEILGVAEVNMKSVEYAPANSEQWESWQLALEVIPIGEKKCERCRRYPVQPDEEGEPLCLRCQQPMNMLQEEN